MVSFELDFMSQSFNCAPDFVAPMMAVPSSQKAWPALSAAARSAPMQWRLATPSGALVSANMPAVTSFRASTDFCCGGSWEAGEPFLAACLGAWRDAAQGRALGCRQQQSCNSRVLLGTG